MNIFSFKDNKKLNNSQEKKYQRVISDNIFNKASKNNYSFSFPIE